MASALADRFSCAGSHRCGRRTATFADFARGVADRVGLGLRSFAAGSGVQAQGLQPMPPGGGLGLGAGGLNGVGFGVHPGIGAGLPGAGAGGAAAPLYKPDLPGLLGRSFSEGVSFASQTPVRDASSASGGRVWSAWFRTVSRRADVGYVGGGGAVRTRLFGFLGGLDRAFGPATVGAAYGFLRGSLDSQFTADERDVLSSGVTWNVMAPYVGYRVSSRVRTWASSAFSLSAAPTPVELGSSRLSTPAPWAAFTPVGADRLDPANGPSFRVNAVGASATVMTPSWGVVDVEADVLAARVVPPEASGGSDPRLAFAERWPYKPTDPSVLPTWSGAASVRRRLGLRVGVPVAFSSRVTGVAAVRWDSGPDVDVIRGAAGGSSRAVDVGADFRTAPSRAPISLFVRYRAELVSDIELLSAEHRGTSSRQSVELAVRLGAVETDRGWSLQISPRYGYPVSPSLLIGGPHDSSAAGRSVYEEPVPILSVDAGYGFRDGSRFVVSGRRPFAENRPPAPAGTFGAFAVGGSAALHLGYERGW